MIRKIILILLCLSISSCGGFSVVSGLKFKKAVKAETNAGNASFTDDVVTLKNEKFISFNRPIGKCGAGITFFGIILPIIPVWITLNNCEEDFIINFYGTWQMKNNVDLKLKYNGTIYHAVSIENITKDGYRKKYKFTINNFWKFRMADDKAIIVTGKTEDGKEFTQELPVKWGVMVYNNWAIP